MARQFTKFMTQNAEQAPAQLELPEGADKSRAARNENPPKVVGTPDLGRAITRALSEREEARDVAEESVASAEQSRQLSNSISRIERRRDAGSRPEGKRKLRAGMPRPAANPTTLLNVDLSDVEPQAVIHNDPKGGALAPIKTKKKKGPAPVTAEEIKARSDAQREREKGISLGSEASENVKNAANEFFKLRNSVGYDMDATGIVNETPTQAGERRAAGGSGLLEGYDDYENHPENTTSMRWDEDAESIINKETGKVHYGDISAKEMKLIHKGKSKQFEKVKGAAVEAGLPVLPSEKAKREAMGAFTPVPEAGAHVREVSPPKPQTATVNGKEVDLAELNAQNAAAGYPGRKKPAEEKPVEMEEVERQRPAAPAPLFRSEKHETAFNARMARLKEVHDRFSGRILDPSYDTLSRQQRTGLHANYQAALKEVDRTHPEPAEGFFAPEQPETPGPIEKVMRRKKAAPAPKPSTSSKNNIINWPTSNEADEGRSEEDLDEEYKKNAKNRSYPTTTTELRGNELPNRGLIKNENQIKRHQDELDEAVKGGAVPQGGVMDEDTKGLAVQLAAHREDHTVTLDNIGQSIHGTHAYLLKKSNAEKATTAASSNHIYKYTGTGPEAELRARAAYSVINNQDRYERGKQVTYDVSDGMHNSVDAEGKPTRKEAYFLTSKGEKVSLKNTSHPEHPGSHLTGDEAPFIGFDQHPAYGNAKPLVAHGDMERGDFIHNGWHPYKDSAGDTVFEKHQVPEGAVHAGTVIKGLIHEGVGPTAAIKKITKGENLDLGEGVDEEGGQTYWGAQPSPIRNANRRPQNPYTHEFHVEHNLISPSCPDCGRIASQASKDRAAAKAAEFDTVAGNLQAEGRAPLGDRGVRVTNAEGKTETRELTKSEQKGPTSNRSEGTFIDMSGGSSATEARKRLGNMVPSGKPAVRSDIDEARAKGHISKSEALELKVSSGILSSDKSKFKDEE